MNSSDQTNIREISVEECKRKVIEKIISCDNINIVTKNSSSEDRGVVYAISVCWHPMNYNVKIIL